MLIFLSLSCQLSREFLDLTIIASFQILYSSAAVLPFGTNLSIALSNKPDTSRQEENEE